MSVMDKANELFNSVDGFCEQNSEHPIVKVLNIGEEKSGLKRGQLCVAGALVSLLFVFVFFGLSFISTIIGVLYPCYMTLLNLNGTREQTRQWLIYWMVFGFFSFKEQFSDILLFWLPFFYEFKIAVLVFCMYPSKQNGTTLLYEKFLIRFVDDDAEETKEESNED